MNKKQLLAARAAFLAKARGYVEAAKSAKRDLAAEEKTEYETAMREIGLIDAQLSVDDGAGQDDTAGVTAERKRAADIRAIGKTARMTPEHIEKAITEGASIEQYRAECLKALATATPVGTAGLGMSDKESRRFSLGKAIRAATLNDWRDAAFEREASIAAQSKSGKGGGSAGNGFTIPFDVLTARRDLNTATGSGTYGGLTIATEVPSFLDYLYASLVCKRAGATTLEGLVGNVDYPILSTGVTAYAVAEGVAATEGAPVFTQIALSPNTVTAYVDLTRRLMLQSALDIEGIFSRHILQQIAANIDLQCLEGTASNDQITGLSGTGSVGTYAIGTNGGTITYAAILDLESDVATAKARGKLGYILHPKMRKSLKQVMTVATYGEKPLWEKAVVAGSDGDLNGYPVYITEQTSITVNKGTSNDCSRIFYGAWQDMIIGLWGGMDVLVNPYIQGKEGIVQLSAAAEFDMGVRPVSFSICPDGRVS